MNHRMLPSKNITPEDMQDHLDSLAHRLAVNTLSEMVFPQFFQIETIRNCNAHCRFCAVDRWDMSNPQLPQFLFDKIVEEMRDYRHWIRMVDVQRAGEPLLDKHLSQRISQLKNIGIRFVTVSTNASLLNEKTATRLLDSGLDEIMISIDSVDKEIYESLRVGLNYETVITNIKNFFALRDKQCPELVIRVRGVSCFRPDDPENQKQIQNWTRFWDEFRRPQDRIYMKKLHTWGNQHIWQEKISEYEHNLDYKPCIAPWSTFHVTSMGRVPLCGQDMDATMTMGDIHNQTIAEIWQGEHFSRIRELHQIGQRNEISFCRGCKIFDPDASLEQANHPKGYFPIPINK
ncbi:MAG: radical SAM protein [Magnetococcales bacterium]|nr:radical SAM protein [Magnetococcales bacterium]